MSTLRLAAAALLAVTSGAGLMLLPAPSARADVTSDQCINARTGTLIHSQFCSCRMRWSAGDHRWELASSAAACSENRELVTGSIAPRQTFGPGPGGGGAGGGGGPGGGGGGVGIGGGGGPG